ncbi:hypothetical protein [uncultured Roseobacter sp.]|uniref:hypothetical protein n=1 Tax=uncultured Roseobacter sp. TaxID=114847 RepID=UPI00260484DF|nr:hypothetical protein [uncultured Roseobacter sp.]
MAYTPTQILSRTASVLQDFTVDVANTAASYQKTFDRTFTLNGKEQARKGPTRANVYQLHDEIARLLDDLPLSPPSGSGQISVAAARTALATDFFDTLEKDRSSLQLSRAIDAYGLFHLLRSPANKLARKTQIQDIKSALSILEQLYNRTVRFAPKLRKLLYDPSVQLSVAFDKAPAVARLAFLQELFSAMPVLDTQQPAANRFKEVQALSFGGTKRINDRISQDAANSLYVADCVFNVGRLAQLADDLPVKLHNDSTIGDTYILTGTPPSADAARMLWGDDPFGQTKKATDLIALGQRTVKLYVSVISVSHQIAATALDANDGSGNKVSGSDAVKRCFAKLMGVAPTTLTKTAKEVEADAIKAVKTGSTKWTKALANVETFVDGAGKLQKIGGRGLQMLGFYGAVKDYNTKGDLTSATKLICTMVQDGASLRAELIAFRLADDVLLDDAAKAAATVGMRRLAMLASIPLMILDAHAAVQGVADATRLNDMSVAFGHFLAGSSSLISGSIGVYMYFAGVAVATGPLGIILVVAMAAGIAGALLIWLSKDPRLQSALDSCFFGKNPSNGTKLMDPDHKFGGTSKTPSGSNKTTWTYTNADLAEQTFTIRSFMYGPGFQVSTKQPSGSAAGSNRRWLYQGIKTSDPKFKRYKDWSYSVRIVDDNSAADQPVPNWKDKGNAADFWAKGAQKVMLLPTKETVAQVIAMIGQGSFSSSTTNFPVLSHGMAGDILEYRVFGPKPENGGRRKMVFRDRAKYR